MKRDRFSSSGVLDQQGNGLLSTNRSGPRKWTFLFRDFPVPDRKVTFVAKCILGKWKVIPNNSWFPRDLFARELFQSELFRQGTSRRRTISRELFRGNFFAGYFFTGNYYWIRSHCHPILVR
jgi:hypothetical protein